MNICQNCIWWNIDRHKDQTEKGSGTCFYDPPRTFEVPVRSAITGAMGIESRSIRPVTKAKDYCGHWKNGEVKNAIKNSRK
jgi:hypothetical protein